MNFDHKIPKIIDYDLEFLDHKEESFDYKVLY